MYTVKSFNENNKLISSNTFKSIPNFHNLTPGTKERISIVTKSLKNVPFKLLKYEGDNKILKVHKGVSYKQNPSTINCVMYDIDLG